MLRLTLISMICLSFLADFALSKRIVCYHTNWSQYRQGPAKFFPEDIDANLCTHVIYAFAILKNGELSSYEWNDESTDWSKGMFDRTMALKKTNPSLKILLAVGGWNFGSTAFSNMVNNVEARNKFVKTSVTFLKTRGFDGLDLDWEYPGSRDGSRPSDKQAFTALCRELKAAYAKDGLLLTAAVGVGKPTVDAGYEIAEISKYLDFINLMTYDLHGAWENFVGHHTALYPRQDESPEQKTLNVDWALNYWTSQGAKPEQINLGLATYGRAFKLTSSKTDMGSPASGAATAGTHTREAGFLAYYEVCEKLSQGWKKAFNNEQQSVYAFSSGEWVGYEDVESIKIKTRFLKSKGLGGAMFWALDLDDFGGKFCGQGKYPLINTVVRELNGGSLPLTTAVPEVSTSSKDPVKPMTTTTPAEPQTTTKGSFTTGSTNKKCPNGDGYYPDLATGCKNYYICEHIGTSYEKVTSFPCPDKTLFDSKSKSCNHDYLVTCA